MHRSRKLAFALVPLLAWRSAALGQPPPEASSIPDWPVAEPRKALAETLSAYGLAAEDKAVPTDAVTFVGIAPCRLVDTRPGFGFSGQYGPPMLGNGGPRSFDLAGRCGIPAGAQAVSLNVTVVGPAGPGYVVVYPKGAGLPNVSTVNFAAGAVLANAAIVPLGATAASPCWRAAPAPTCCSTSTATSAASRGSTGAGRGAPRRSTRPTTWRASTARATSAASTATRATRRLPVRPGTWWRRRASGGVALGDQRLQPVLQQRQRGARHHHPGEQARHRGRRHHARCAAGALLAGRGEARLEPARRDGADRPGSAAAHLLIVRDWANENKVWIDAGGLVHTAFQKVCSVFGNGWRDTIPVPGGWPASACESLKTSLGATVYQLACFTDFGYAFGGANGGIPTPNCGW